MQDANLAFSSHHPTPLLLALELEVASLPLFKVTLAILPSWVSLRSSRLNGAEKTCGPGAVLVAESAKFFSPLQVTNCSTPKGAVPSVWVILPLLYINCFQCWLLGSPISQICHMFFNDFYFLVNTCKPLSCWAALSTMLLSKVFHLKKQLWIKNVTFRNCSAPQAAAELINAKRVVVRAGGSRIPEYWMKSLKLDKDVWCI